VWRARATWTDSNYFSLALASRKFAATSFRRTADGHLDGVCAACKAGKACEPMCAACEAGACVRPMAEWAYCDCVVCHRLRELDAAGIASLVQAAPGRRLGQDPR
jgi:hypothetical protein